MPHLRRPRLKAAPAAEPEPEPDNRAEAVSKPGRRTAARRPMGESDTLRGLRILALAIRTERLVFTGAASGAALYGGMTVAAAWAVGWATNNVILPDFDHGHAAAGGLVLAGALIAGVAVAKVVGIFGRRLLAGVLQFRMQARYRRLVTAAYLRLPLYWHQRHPTGQLLSNANSDVEMSFMPISPLPMSIGVIVMLLIGIADMFVTDHVLGWIGALLIPVVVVINTFYMRFAGPRFARAQQLRAHVAEVAHESFDGALVIKTLGREEAEAERFAARARELRDANIAAGRARSLFDPLLEALPNLGVLAVLLVGALQVAVGRSTPGDVVSVAYLITLLAFPIRAIGWVLGDLPRAVVGFERVQSVLAAEDRVDYGTARLAPGGAVALELDAVDFAYEADSANAAKLTQRVDDTDPEEPENTGTGTGTGTDADSGATADISAAAPPAPVLRGVSARIEPGRTVALVGATGAGKSTLAALLARLADPTGGAIRLDGADLRDLARGEVPAAVALVAQQSFLFGDTVRNNITLGDDYPEDEVWAALRTAQAEKFVRALPDGVDSVVGERGTTLSGGQRQRLALARALIRRPRLLVLDDCTSAVDPSVEAAILGGLKDGTLGATVVVIAYRRATVALADEVLFLEDGVIADRGGHTELLGRCAGYRDLISAYARAAEDAEKAAATTAGHHDDLAGVGA